MNRYAIIPLYKSFKHRLYMRLKLTVMPLEMFSSYMPKAGNILDVGSGYGYVSNFLSRAEEYRLVQGIEPNYERFKIADESEAVCNFILGKAENMHGSFDAMIMIDVLHHIPYDEQLRTLKNLYSQLKPGGTLFIRETGKNPRKIRYWLFNWLLEWLLYPNQEKLRFRHQLEWRALIALAGFNITHSFQNKWYSPYLHEHFVCRKPK